MGAISSRASPPLSDAELVATALKDVQVFAGYKATQRRLMFVYENDIEAKTKLFTVLESGATEGTAGGKTLVCGKGKAVVTYPYPQYMTEANARPHLGTGVVWKDEENDGYALVQLWTINYNEKFLECFDVQTTPPAGTNAFDPKAVENLHRALANIFGPGAEDVGVKYCTKETTQVYERTYVGTAAELKRFMGHPGVKECLGILKAEGDGFEVSTTNEKGSRGKQIFSFGRDDQSRYVLYKRDGFTSFMCLKTLEQFEEEALLHGELKP